MKKERDKFLTEAMDECWHEYYRYQEPNSLGSMQCGKCRTFRANNDFSTWHGFGKLWEWSQKQEWWHRYGSPGHYIVETDVHPDCFAEAVYAFLKERTTP